MDLFLLQQTVTGSNENTNKTHDIRYNTCNGRCSHLAGFAGIR